MTNKQQINKLKDNAELAWASYGYFHYFLEQHNKPDYIDKVHYTDAKDENGKYKLDNNNKKVKRPIEITDILDMNYKKCDVFEYNSFLKRYDRIGTLNGDFTPTQSKNFFDRYELLKHCPNTNSGFSATLFEDTQDSNQKVFAIRGTEFPSGFFDDVLDADKDLALGKLSSNQYIDMIKFYVECIEKEHIKESTSLESL